MYRIIILIVSVSMTITCRSQTNEFHDISADRPGMATSPFIAQSKNIQIETGFSCEMDKRANSFQETFLYNTTLLRYGLFKNAEIRLQTDYMQLKTDTSNITGFDPLIIGTKILIIPGGKIIPQSSFLFNITLPWFGNQNFRPRNPAPSFYLLFQNDLTKKLNICYNLGLEYDGTVSKPAEFFALCFSYNITDKFSAFLESYNWFSCDTKSENFVDCGFAYLLKKNIQLDLSGNMNLRDLENYYMINLGVSWRILK